MTVTTIIMNAGNHPDDEITVEQNGNSFVLHQGDYELVNAPDIKILHQSHGSGPKARDHVPALLMAEGPGADLVRVSSKSSGRDQVDRIKQLAAALINECDAIRMKGGKPVRHASLAITAIEEGAMWAVKAGTTPE